MPPPPELITVSTSRLDFGDVPVNSIDTLSLQLSNAGAIFANVLTKIDSSVHTAFSFDPPSPINLFVGDSKAVLVHFAPQVEKSYQETLLFWTEDNTTNIYHVILSGRAVLAKPASFELVLDRSGSMAGPALSGTKLQALATAVDQFADLVAVTQGNEMGAVEFNGRADTVTAFGSYDVAQRGAITNAVGPAFMAAGTTSIGAGLQKGLSELIPAAKSRAVMLVFTDGWENTAPCVSSVEADVTKAAEVYAIGFGQAQNIQVSVLNALAASSNGQFFQTDNSDRLRKLFLQVLADAYRSSLAVASDPFFRITEGEQVSIPVEVTKCDTHLTFILNWADSQSRVGFTVVAPDHTTYTPDSPLSDASVQYVEKPRYSFYRIAFDTPGSGSGGVARQAGTWQMNVRGVDIAGASERCSTSVLVASQLHLQVNVTAVDATQPIQVTASVISSKDIVTSADVSVTITAPTVSLAEVSTPSVISRAINADSEPIPADQQPLVPTEETRYSLFLAKDGQYFSVEVPAPNIDGVYQFEFRATGRACGGTFERYSTFSLYIRRPISTRKTVFKVARSSPTSATVLVTPKDDNGHNLGPGLAHFIKSEIDRGIVYAAVDLWDGSYTHQVVFGPSSDTPTLNFTMAGTEIAVSLAGTGGN